MPGPTELVRRAAGSTACRRPSRRAVARVGARVVVRARRLGAQVRRQLGGGRRVVDEHRRRRELPDVPRREEAGDQRARRRVREELAHARREQRPRHPAGEAHRVAVEEAPRRPQLDREQGLPEGSLVWHEPQDRRGDARPVERREVGRLDAAEDELVGARRGGPARNLRQLRPREQQVDGDGGIQCRRRRVGRAVRRHAHRELDDRLAEHRVQRARPPARSRPPIPPSSKKFSLLQYGTATSASTSAPGIAASSARAGAITATAACGCSAPPPAQRGAPTRPRAPRAAEHRSTAGCAPPAARARRAGALPRAPSRAGAAAPGAKDAAGRSDSDSARRGTPRFTHRHRRA